MNMKMTIPKIIFQTSKYKLEQYIIDKILQKCNDWKYIHYNDEEAIQFFNENYIEEFKDIVIKFNQMTNGAHKADLLRYYHLYITGGVFIDSDAMLETNMVDIVKDYTFFSVNSIIPNAIFQGFIGCTPRNSIIYKALYDAYHINLQELSSNYHLLCYHLYNIIQTDESNEIIHLYNEKHVKYGLAETFNDNNETILIHYFGDKVIPK